MLNSGGSNRARGTPDEWGPRTGPGLLRDVPRARCGGAGLTGQVRQEPGIAVDLVEQNVAAELIGFRAPPKDHHGVPQQG